MTIEPIERRDFLKLAGATAVLGLTQNGAASSPRQIAVWMDSADPDASGEPARRAVEKLRQAFASKGIQCDLLSSLDHVTGADFCILVAPRESVHARKFLIPAHSKAINESVVLAPGQLGGTPALLVSGVGQRGFVYGLLE